MPRRGADASAHALFGVSPRRASSVRAERSFCCSLGTPNAFRIERDSAIRFVAGVARGRRFLGIQDDLVDQAIELTLLRKVRADSIAKRGQPRLIRIPE